MVAGLVQQEADDGTAFRDGPDKRTALEDDSTIELSHPALAGLEPVALHHAPLFTAAMEGAGRTAWRSYFPYLLCTSRPSHLILHEQRDDALLVYLLRTGERARLRLLFLPAPWTDDALIWAEQRLRAFNGGAPPMVEWVEEDDALRLARRQYRIQLRHEEFIYDRAAVAALEGSRFKSLRKELARARKHSDVLLRPYAASDEAACMNLVHDWRARLRAQGLTAEGYFLTRRCLRIADRIPPDLLTGRVAEVEGRVCGFLFAGPISRGYGSLFVGVSDHSLKGVSYVLGHEMMRIFPDITYFNDSDDAGRDGLREVKMRFRPVAMKALFRGRAE